ncbi:MAG: hypothetical protein EBX35_05190, partial [Planctomycetia bacterium]|nr:hypothetical protein [Planctomycetia bacterium]
MAAVTATTPPPVPLATRLACCRLAADSPTIAPPAATATDRPIVWLAASWLANKLPPLPIATLP